MSDKNDKEKTPTTPAQIQQIEVEQPKLLNQNARILVGIITKEYVHVKWHVQSDFFNQILPPNTIKSYSTSYGVDLAREEVVNTFMSIPEATHLLFFDTDIIIPQEQKYAVWTMVNDNVPMVSGLYFNSLFTGLNAWKDEKALDFRSNTFNINNLINPVFEVDKVGMGFCLIKKDLIKLLSNEEGPLFHYHSSRNMKKSEDFHFCDLLAKYKIKPYVDLRIKLLHMKMAMIDVNMNVTF